MKKHTKKQKILLNLNKEQWITILLDESVEKEEIKQLIDLSYELTK